MRARQLSESGYEINTGVRILRVYVGEAVRGLARHGLRACRLVDGYPEWKRAGPPVSAGEGG